MLCVTEALYVSTQKLRTVHWRKGHNNDLLHRYIQNSCPDKLEHLLSGELSNDNTIQTVQKTVDKYPRHKRDSNSWDFLIFILKYKLYLSLLLWFPSNGIKNLEIWNPFTRLIWFLGQLLLNDFLLTEVTSSRINKITTIFFQ
jgi:hypothetical protein